MIDTVLLDIDGTLLDSNDAHAAAWVEAFKDFGIAKDFSDIRKLIGMGSDHLVTTLLPISPDDPVIEKLGERRCEIFRRSYLNKLNPFRGARKLVEKILSHNMQAVVASSASQEDLKGLLKRSGIEDLIRLTTCSDDVERSKPSPDIIIVALGKAQARPWEAVMIGDTPYDLQASRRAGVQSFAFTCGGWCESDLKDALAIYEGPWDLVERFDQSILGHGHEIVLGS